MNSISQNYPNGNNEIWKDVPGYEGMYQASTHGRVRGLDRINGVGRSWKGKVLSPKIDKKGYKHVLLYKNGKRRHYQIQILVALTFIGRRPKNHETHHIDNNPSNNHVSNLIYLSKKQHAKTKSKVNLIGSANPQSVLTEGDVNLIRKLYGADPNKPYSRGSYSQKELAKMYGVSQSHISRILRFKSWDWE